MASYPIAAKAPFGAVETLREFTLVSEILNGFVVWYTKHKTRKALLDLSEAQLDDIGLCRADVL
ncbi:DUF1127 domain-containing protein [Cognatishimia sp. WU-CL00825]|uniref:DUF1127 domain-containing protein n=1 Tax=Cognatishimia sp. WU-CL00825 TaxID=3127658 RepID=UPI0031096C21